jgi:polyisoprenoid-binding protein YceI
MATMHMKPMPRHAGPALPRAHPVLLAASVLTLLSACQPRTSVPEHAPVTAAPAEGRAYQLDPAASRFEFRLHADGPLASVGHTHVISARELAGTIWLQAPPGRSSCALQLPVASLVVDDPGERAAAGGEFAEPLDTDARTGTRDHMLGDKQLDAARYPTVWLQCRAIHVQGDGATVELAVTLRGRATVLQVPAQWRQHGDTLEAEGEFDFRQSALGLEPYSLLFGALRVADVIHARFTLHARAQG